MRDGYYQVYGVEQMRQQMQAVYDAGYEEWIFWDQASRFEITDFLPEWPTHIQQNYYFVEWYKKFKPLFISLLFPRDQIYIKIY